MDENKINLQDSTKSAVMKMCEGNPGALNVLMQLDESKDVPGLIIMCHLDDMKIYGSMIWVCYKDICGEDIELLKKKIVDRTIKDELIKTREWEYSLTNK